jgi:hypothetical protein
MDGGVSGSTRGRWWPPRTGTAVFPTLGRNRLQYLWLVFLFLSKEIDIFLIKVTLEKRLSFLCIHLVLWFFFVYRRASARYGSTITFRRSPLCATTAAAATAPL